MINSPVDEIKSKLDVIDIIGGYIKIQKAGRNYKASCPFHSEKTPSFMISPERQLWRCFGCNRGGSIFDFVMEIEGVEFGDALKILAQRAGIELKKIDPKLKTERTHLYEISNLANRFFIKQLQASQSGKKAQKYLISRGLKPKEIEKWQIGYAPNQWQALSDFLGSRGYSDQEILKTGLSIKSEKNISRNKYYDRFRDRIIFPIHDINGIVVGFTGRENPENPDNRMGKYINTPNTIIYDKSRILYGLDKAKLDIRKDNLCILVEGQTDVIMSHQAGFKNAVASSGTALTDQQLKIIKRYTDNLTMAFDMDLAGEMATQRGINLAIQFGFNTNVISLSDNQDPADFIQKNPLLWSKAIKQAQGLIEFYLSNAFSKHDPQTARGKKEISKILLPIIKKIPNKVEQAHWLQEVARRLSVKEEVLVEEMKKIKDLADERNFELSQEQPDNLNNPYFNLEEYALGLILCHLKEFKNPRTKQPNFFLKPDLEQIFNILKENKNKNLNLSSFKRNLPDKFANRVDELVFKTEIKKNLIEEFSLKKEVEFCFNQLENRYFRQKLNKLNSAIQEAENNKDNSTLKKLTKEFNKLAKRI